MLDASRGALEEHVTLACAKIPAPLCGVSQFTLCFSRISLLN
jgi:hypothetical protein